MKSGKKKMKHATIFILLINVAISSPMAFAQEQSTPSQSLVISGDIHQIETTGEYLVVRTDQVYLINISNPEQAFVVGALDIGPTWDMALLGHHIFAVTYSDELIIIDISAPESPVIESVLRISGDPIEIDIATGLAYLACYDNKIVVVDIKNTKSPDILSITGTPDQARQISVHGRFLYVGSTNRLWTYNVIDPKAPLLLEEIQTDDLMGGILGIEAHENLIYLLMRGYIAVAEKTVHDETSLIYKEDSASIFTNFSFDLQGSLVCLISGNGWVQFIDYSRPAKPIRLGSLELIGCDGGVCFVNNFGSSAESVGKTSLFSA